MSLLWQASSSDTTKLIAHITKKRTGISDFTVKKKTSTTKLDTHSTNEDKSSSHTDGVANIENNSGGHSIFGFSDG